MASCVPSNIPLGQRTKTRMTRSRRPGATVLEGTRRDFSILSDELIVCGRFHFRRTPPKALMSVLSAMIVRCLQYRFEAPAPEWPSRRGACATTSRRTGFSCTRSRRRRRSGHSLSMECSSPTRHWLNHRCTRTATTGCTGRRLHGCPRPATEGSGSGPGAMRAGAVVAFWRLACRLNRPPLIIAHPEERRSIRCPAGPYL